MTPAPILIHDLASAAERAKVTPEVIRRWITQGLKATPVGSIGKRGRRDFRIFDSWLTDFLEARAVRAFPKPAPEPAPAARRGFRAAGRTPGGDYVTMPEMPGEKPR